VLLIRGTFLNKYEYTKNDHQRLLNLSPNPDDGDEILVGRVVNKFAAKIELFLTSLECRLRLRFTLLYQQ
jgi:hypothetical protein